MTTAPSERRRRRPLIALLVGGLLAVLAPSTSLAQSGNPDSGGGDYVTTTTPATRSLDVSAFSPECIGTAPYIRYTVVPIGFTPTSSTVEMVFRDRTGTVVETRTVDGLSGTTIFPGAEIDENGNAVDWPGWTRAEDGSWIPDPTDAGVREGLSIDVTVDGVTATARVAYPAAGTPCDGPDVDEPCVPVRNGDGNPDDDCDLATTGGGGGTTLLVIAAASLVAGLALVVGAQRRRRHGVTAPPPAA